MHAAPGEEIVPGSAFRRRQRPPGGPVTVAAFGARAIAAAAEHGDRMLLDVVSPAQVRALRATLDEAAERAGGAPPQLAAWLPVAVDPEPDSLTQILRSIVGCLTVPGYNDMFAAAGLGEVVELARSGATPDVLFAALPPKAVTTVALVGDATAVCARLDAYAESGLDEIAVVPATAADPAGERTLTALEGRGTDGSGPSFTGVRVMVRPVRRGCRGASRPDRMATGGGSLGPGRSGHSGVPIRSRLQLNRSWNIASATFSFVGSLHSVTR